MADESNVLRGGQRLEDLHDVLDVIARERLLYPRLDPPESLGRNLRRGTGARERARQQNLGTIDYPSQAPRRSAEFLLPAGRKRPIVVGNSLGAPGHGGRVADDQELHGPGNYRLGCCQPPHPSRTGPVKLSPSTMSRCCIHRDIRFDSMPVADTILKCPPPGGAIKETRHM